MHESSDNQSLTVDEGICGARTKSGGVCRSRKVRGKKRCRMHGANAGRPPKHGLYSQKTKIQVDARVKELLTNPKLMDLKSHVALSIALLERAVQGINDDPKADKLEQAKVVGQISTNLARVCETQHKIEVGYYYSPEKVQLIMNMIAGTMNKYCAECDRLQEVAGRIRELPMPE